MHRTLSLSLILFATLKADVDTAWVRRYNGPGNQTDWAYCLAADSAGNLYVSGGSYGGASADDWATIKYRPNGDTAWVRRLSSGSNVNERSNSMMIGKSGNIYLTGYTMVGGNGNYLTVKYSPEGETIWTRRYNPSSGYEFCRCLGLDDSENVYVTGYSQSSGLSNWDIATIKYSPDGVERWVQRWDGGLALADEPNALAVDRMGNAHIAGFSRNSRNSDFIILKYSPTGTLLWERRFSGPGDSTDIANAIVVDSLGNVYVVGQSFSPVTKGDIVTIKYGPDGDTLWTRIFNGLPGDSSDVGMFVALDPRGAVYVSGYSYRSGNSADFVVIKYTPEGDTQWVRYYDGPAHGFDQGDGGLILDPQGNVYAAGRGPSVPGGTSDYVILKLDPDGNQVWVYRYDGLGFSDWIEGIALDPMNNVFVTGYSSNGSYGDYLTVKLRQSQPARHDVGVQRIVSPLGVMDSGTVVVPACSVYNFGDTVVSFRVRMRIGVDYEDTVLIIDHDPGTSRYVAFSEWQALYRGRHAVVCSTELITDVAPYNDRQRDTIMVQVHDAGVVTILAPVGTIQPGPVIPQVTVHNFGTSREPAEVILTISEAGYLQTVALSAGLPLGEDTIIAFPTWDATAGSFTLRCSVALTGDQIPVNDTLSTLVEVIPPIIPEWQTLTSMPAGPKAKNVKDGGALVAVITAGESLVYAFKGGNTGEFFAYNRATQSWTTKESIPAVGPSGKKKYVKKGSALACNPEPGTIYAVKGNNTREFWSYDIATGTWRSGKDVPLGNSGRALKGGTGMVWCNQPPDSGALYLLKGSNTTEFYRYDIARDTWQELTSAPLGISGRAFKDGSCLAIADGHCYALKGSYNEFYAYDLVANNWTTKAGLPFVGSSGKKRKARTGASLTASTDRLFAFKGGNCLEFWSYRSDSNSWQQLADLLLGGGRKVKGGGALARLGDYVYALKGNNTLEFYRYGPLSAISNTLYPVPGTAANDQPALPDCGIQLRTAPNPFSRTAVISYTLPHAGWVSLKLYDVSGRSVMTPAEGYQSGGRHQLQLSDNSLPSGVYLLRLETGTTTATAKLTVK